MVDARIVHTTGVLRAAILRLAAERPVSRITVSDVTRAAGINRATFYAHAVSPGSLLAQVLMPELDQVRIEDAAARHLPGSDPAALTRTAIDRVVDHIVTYREIYRRALPDPDDGSLHRLLAGHFAESCIEHIAQLPAAHRPDMLDDVAAAFIGHGLVGAVEAWLAGPRRSRRALADTMSASFPTWWR